MNLHRAQQVVGRASAICVAVALGIPANAHPRSVCTDTVFVNGFDGASHAGAGATIALASDGFDFFTFDVQDPGSLTNIGSSQGAAFRLAFVDGNFGRAYGLAQTYAVSPGLLATIRLSDAAVTPIGTAGPQTGDWTGIKQDPVSGELYAASGCPSSSTLYTIDRNTAALHVIGNLGGIPCAAAIAIDAHGDMYAIDAISDELFAIDKSTLDTSPIGALDFDVGEVDMDFARVDGVLYAAAVNYSAGRIELRELDTQSGASTLVGVMPVAGITGFAIENDVVCSP